MPESAKLIKSKAYAWFDAEFTSLELETANLLQVAVILTDNELKRLHPPEEDINLFIRIEEGQEVSDWVQKNLSALVEKCKSDEAVSLEEADAKITALIDTYCNTPNKTINKRPILAGNSVHNDWFLMRRLLPIFNSRMHYRLLDVSALKVNWMDWGDKEPFDKEQVELIRAFGPDQDLGETNAHDALFDIKASIAELAWYRSKMAVK